MTIRCTACLRENPDTVTYCRHCGNALSAPSGASFSSSQSGRSGASAASAGAYYSQVPPQHSPAGSSSSSQPFQTFAQQPSTGKHPIAQMGTPTSALIGNRHAFAGYGIPANHQSWLLSRQAARADDVFSTVMSIMGMRGSQNIRLQPAKIQEQGIKPEERYYLIVQRGVSTVFVYIAPSGNDLYISRATMVKCSLDLLRITIFCLLLAVAILGPSISSAILSNMTTNLFGNLLGSSSGPSLGTSLCFSGLLFLASVFSWIYLILHGIRSLRYWMREKDSLIYLRNLTLRDFEVDDIMLLEHATDETIREALQQLKLDASQIVPPAQGYQQQRRLVL